MKPLIKKKHLVVESRGPLLYEENEKKIQRLQSTPTAALPRLRWQTESRRCHATIDGLFHTQQLVVDQTFFIFFSLKTENAIQIFDWHVLVRRSTIFLESESLSTIFILFWPMLSQ
jgi:hypothetical protein